MTHISSLSPSLSLVVVAKMALGSDSFESDLLLLGFTNLPEYVPVYGELPILPDTYYSVELFARHFVPERNEFLRFMLEENVYWRNETQRWEFIRGRQERYHLIDTTRHRVSESEEVSGSLLRIQGS